MLGATDSRGGGLPLDDEVDDCGGGDCSLTLAAILLLAVIWQPPTLISLLVFMLPLTVTLLMRLAADGALADGVAAVVVVVFTGGEVFLLLTLLYRLKMDSSVSCVSGDLEAVVAVAVDCGGGVDVDGLLA